MLKKKPHKDDDPGGPGRSGDEKSGQWNTFFWLYGGLVLLLLMAPFLGTTRVSGHAVGGGPIGESAAGMHDSPATFRQASCPFTLGAGIVEGQQVICGYVTVPQNHHINNGQVVKLAVAIYKSQRYIHSVDPTPILRLEGGPGISDLNGGMSTITAANYNKWVFNHDLVFFDQRGTGYSTPSLDCFGQPLPACYDRLVFSGINLGDFNTLENAADVADIIHALGYQQMTLYGVSYGGRLALIVLRLYPQVVRAVVLDSAYLPNHNRDEQAASAQRAFTELFRSCAADPVCNAKYPNLQSVFANTVDQLNAHPINFNLIISGAAQPYLITNFTGDQWVKFVLRSLYYTSFIPRTPKSIFHIPLLISQVKQHIYDWLVTLPKSVAFEAGTTSDSLFYSVECSDDWPFLTQQDITNSLQGVMPQIAGAVGGLEQSEYNVCQFWKVPPAPLALRQPVASNIPALVLAGQYDPITPPSNAQEAASYLSNSYFFLIPGAGHEVQYSSSCVDGIISAFEDDPSQRPDSSCLSQMKAPAFL